jgi:hypothetical protein
MRIDITVQIQFEEVVVGSSISQVSYVQDDGSIRYDADALADYEEFCTDFELELERYTELLDFKVSSSSETSRYYFVYPLDEYGNALKQVIVEIRMSDHELPPYHKSRTNDRRKESLSRLTGKSNQRYILRDFVINGIKYNSYDSALSDVIGRVKTIVKNEIKRKNRR